MDLLSLLPKIEHFGLFGYWLILIIAFLEAIPVAGMIIPGATIVVAAGFFSANGYLDLGDLIWFSSFGAILGDLFGYYLGTKGDKFFKPENRWLKLSHLEQGKYFFTQYGGKSVFLGRFIGPLRALIPFVAGLSRMEIKKFIFWDIISGILWSVSHLLLGYFFGNAFKAIETWSTRAGWILVFLVAVVGIIWYWKRKIKPNYKLR